LLILHKHYVNIIPAFRCNEISHRPYEKKRATTSTPWTSTMRQLSVYQSISTREFKNREVAQRQKTM